MTSPPAATDASQPPPLPYWTWALGVTVVLTLARMLAIRMSPLELYPDEAQYWLWSRALEPGYFSEPPLIAWLVRLTTLGGDAEPFVRLPSPLLHAAAGLLLYGVGRRLYAPVVGFFAMLVYELMPAVQIGAFVLSTDTPLVACLAAALLAYVILQGASGRARLAAAAWFGLAMGLAFLAKYAALYGLAGVALHLGFSRHARQAWRPGAALLSLAIFGLVIAPNVAWNFANHLAAAREVVSQAAGGARAGGPLAGLDFLASQLAVFGPIPLAALIGGAVWLAWRRRLTAEDALLVAWTLPVLAIVLVQALVAGAKADWAVAAFVPGSVLVAAWMLRWGRPRVLIAVLAAHMVVVAAVLVGEDEPRLLDRVGLASVLQGVRGGRDLARQIVSRAQTEILTGDPLTAVAVDDRRLFDTTAYYGRDFFGEPGAPPLLAWRAGPAPTNGAELVSPLTAAAGDQVLMISRDGRNTAAMRAQFQHAGDVALIDEWTDPKHKTGVAMFVGDGFTPPKR